MKDVRCFIDMAQWTRPFTAWLTACKLPNVDCHRRQPIRIDGGWSLGRTWKGDGLWPPLMDRCVPGIYTWVTPAVTIISKDTFKTERKPVYSYFGDFTVGIWLTVWAEYIVQLFYFEHELKEDKDYRRKEEVVDNKSEPSFFFWIPVERLSNWNQI